MKLTAALVVALTIGAAFCHAADGDPKRGAQIYQRCLACHSLEHNRSGPRHCGLLGRRAGSVPGFEYSPAMKRSKLVWNEKTLNRFLADPPKAVPGTTMIFISYLPPPIVPLCWSEKAPFLPLTVPVTRSIAT